MLSSSATTLAAQGQRRAALRRTWQRIRRKRSSQHTEEEEEEDQEVAVAEKSPIATAETPLSSENEVEQEEALSSKDEKLSRPPVFPAEFNQSWKLVVDEDFKSSYDVYLRRLGQPLLVRQVAQSVVGRTTEETKLVYRGDGDDDDDDEATAHSVDDDRPLDLWIRGRNVRGVWERTLRTVQTTIMTADGEKVQAIAWWDTDGTHHSRLLNVQKYCGGGEFASKRYLLHDNDTVQYVCETTFLPNDSQYEPAFVTWTFVPDISTTG